jgi:hypothetical protein
VTCQTPRSTGVQRAAPDPEGKHTPTMPTPPPYPALRDQNITVTPEARTTISNMVAHVQQLRADYGDTGGEYVAAATSLVAALHSLFRWDELRVMRDGDLSLLCQTHSLVFGVIFHREGQPREDGLAPPGTWSLHS